MASDHSSASRLANDSEEGFSSSLFQASNTRRSVSHHHTSQFSHSLSVHPSSDSSNRDSSKEELFSKQSTNSAHGLRMAVQDVAPRRVRARSRGDARSRPLRPATLAGTRVAAVGAGVVVAAVRVAAEIAAAPRADVPDRMTSTAARDDSFARGRRPHSP